MYSDETRDINLLVRQRLKLATSDPEGLYHDWLQSERQLSDANREIDRLKRVNQSQAKEISRARDSVRVELSKEIADLKATLRSKDAQLKKIDQNRAKSVSMSAEVSKEIADLKATLKGKDIEIRKLEKERDRFKKRWQDLWNSTTMRIGRVIVFPAHSLKKLLKSMTSGKK